MSSYFSQDINLIKGSGTVRVYFNTPLPQTTYLQS
jgi:hypothetical protein